LILKYKVSRPSKSVYRREKIDLEPDAESSSELLLLSEDIQQLIDEDSDDNINATLFQLSSVI